jgi:hypothetical protein
MPEIGVRGGGTPPNFTGKNVLGLCLARARSSGATIQSKLVNPSNSRSSDVRWNERALK